MMPIETLTPEGDTLLEHLCANVPHGRLSDDLSPAYQDAIRRLDQFAFPVGDVPSGSCTAVHGAARNAAYLLVKPLLRAARGKAIPTEFAAAIDTMFEAAFGTKPDQAWIPPFLEALRRAALQLQNWERRIAKLSVERQSAFSAPPQLLELATRVLIESREAMRCWPADATLPPWLGVELTAYLIPRIGFRARGGGANRVISEKKLRAVLSDPSLLIADLQKAPNGKVLWRATIGLLKREVQQRATSRIGKPVTSKLPACPDRRDSPSRET